MTSLADSKVGQDAVQAEEHGEPEWMNLSAIEQAKQERDKCGAEAVRERVKNRVERDMLRKSLSRKRQRKSAHTRYKSDGEGLVTLHEDPLALDDYHSDDDGSQNRHWDERGNNSSSSSSSDNDSDNK
jgi:hypothetical protein